MVENTANIIHNRKVARQFEIDVQSWGNWRLLKDYKYIKLRDNMLVIYLTHIVILVFMMFLGDFSWCLDNGMKLKFPYDDGRSVYFINVIIMII